MNLSEQTEWLLKKYRLRPDTDRGQNFLIADKVLTAIVSAGELSTKDTVVEIGCGLGVLTTALAAKAGRVIGFETDRRLIPILDTIQTHHQNLEIHYESFLKFYPGEIGKSYKIIANVPYYLTGKILKTIFSWPTLPSLVVIMIQKEVAEKIVAPAGKLSKQSLGVQLYGHPEIVQIVPAASFRPIPAVDSAIVKIDNIHSWQYRVPEKLVWQFIKMGFSSKRKKLINNLSAGLQITKEEVGVWLERAQINPNLRAEGLSLDDWMRLTGSWHK